MTTTKNRSKVTRMFLFDNTIENKYIIKSMAKALNRSKYTISCRGRGPRQRGRYHQDLPLRLANQIVVYVKEKPNIRERFEWG